MTRKITHALLTLALLLGLGASMTQPAEAHRRGGLAAGLAIGTVLGLGIAGAYAGPRYYGYEAGPAATAVPASAAGSAAAAGPTATASPSAAAAITAAGGPTICD